MKIWHNDNYGVPMWGPSKKSKNLIATGSNNAATEEGNQQYLRIS
jgi:hypothetical protein